MTAHWSPGLNIARCDVWTAAIQNRGWCSAAKASALLQTYQPKGRYRATTTSGRPKTYRPQAPASSVLPAGSFQHEPAAISNAWAQAVGKVQQRSTAIAQETARERAAEMGKPATKAPIARSEGLRKSVGARTPPPRIPLSSKAAVANSLEDFDRLWDSLAACAAPRCANMPSPQEATQPNALTQTSQPDLVLSVPTGSERSQEHQDQTPKVAAILRDSSAPCVPSEPHGRGEPEARRTVWGRAMAMLLRTRVRASVKDAILQINAENLRMNRGAP